nr:hypothetical protein [Helcococcus sueciensis]
MNINYLRIRIKEIIFSKEFQAILVISSIIMNYYYYIKIKSSINSYQSQSIDYYNLFFSNDNMEFLFAGYYLSLFISILAVAATSTIYVNDKNIGLKNKFIMILDRKNYYMNNIIIIFISTFILLFLPFFINFLLTLLIYNKDAFIDLGMGVFFSPISIYNMPLIEIYKISPLLLNFIYTLIPAIAMSIWAIFIYSLSLFIKDAKAYHISIISLMLYMMIDFSLEFLGHPNLRFSLFFYPETSLRPKLNFSYFIVMCIMLIFLSIINVILKVKYFKDEI